MDITGFLSNLIAIQLSGSLLFFSVISTSLYKEGTRDIGEREWQKQTEQLLLIPSAVMQAGSNDFIDISGWDGGPYRVSIILEYKTNDMGQRYLVREPRFFVMQRGSEISIAMSSIGIRDNDNNKIRYKCIAHPDGYDPGLIHFGFEQYVTHKNIDKPGDSEMPSIQFASPDGYQWRACADTTLISINDSTALLKWRVEKMQDYKPGFALMQ